MHPKKPTYLHSRNGMRSKSVVSTDPSPFSSSSNGLIGTQFSGWRLFSKAWALTYIILPGSLLSLDRSWKKQLYFLQIIDFTIVTASETLTKI